MIGFLDCHHINNVGYRIFIGFIWYVICCAFDQYPLCYSHENFYSQNLMDLKNANANVDERNQPCLLYDHILLDLDDDCDD